LAFNLNGIYVLNFLSPRKEVLEVMRWDEVVSWRSEEGKAFHMTVGSLQKPQKYFFLTKCPDAIKFTFEAYLDLLVAIRSGLTEYDIKSSRGTVRIENPIPFTSAEERIKEDKKSKSSCAQTNSKFKIYF